MNDDIRIIVAWLSLTPQQQDQARRLLEEQFGLPRELARPPLAAPEAPCLVEAPPISTPQARS